jgi:hypothetical protein
MSDVFIRLGQGGAVSWKSAVDSATSLPSSGNQTGDVRAVKDTSELYIWNGSSWAVISGSGGGSTPGGSEGSIQFNTGGTFDGSAELVWDSTDKFLGLNGLAIKSLSSSISLVDDTSTPTTAFSYDASLYNYSIVEYSLTRGSTKQVGRMLIVNDSTNVTINNDFSTLGDPGVIFSASISGTDVLIQYITTSTGFNAFLKYSIRQWI